MMNEKQQHIFMWFLGQMLPICLRNINVLNIKIVASLRIGMDCILPGL